MVLTLDPKNFDMEQAELDKFNKGYTFSLLIPARGADAALAIGDIVAANHEMWMRRYRLIDEIGVLIDPDSNGDYHDMERIALEAGASWVAKGSDVLRLHSPGELPAHAGKAGAMRSLAFAAKGTHLLFHDADLRNYDPMTVGLLVAAAVGPDAPLVVNGSSQRLTGEGHQGGRTTEMLRSLLSKQLRQYVPGVTSVVQPLIGEFVIQADVFARLPFSRGYGVETSLKVLALDMVGADKFAQIELPAKHQTGQHYLDLVKQFHEIGFTVDVLERWFQLRLQGMSMSPCEIADHYDLYFPHRTPELHRPDGYDDLDFVPRTTFYQPLETVQAYRRRGSEIVMARRVVLGEGAPCAG